MLQRPLVVLLATALLIPLACTDSPTETLLEPVEPSAAVVKAPGLTVMSQNMYLGANIDLLLAASTPQEFAVVFQQLQTSNAEGFGRAQKLAMQILEEAPHFVGLQEVTRYTFTFPAPVGTQTMDFLSILKAYLDYFYSIGATPYMWNPIRHDLAASAPIILPGLPVITYTDGDAILVRNDVQILEAPTLVKFDVFETFSLAGYDLDMRRGYLAVTAEVDGQTIRFANTHLEVQRFGDTQTAQIEQLIEELDEATLPVVLVGDFNSAANHDAAPEEKSPAYHMLRKAGFSDLWLRERKSVTGYTCCQGPDLTNPISELSQRLDLIMVRYGKAGFGGQSKVEIIGEEVSDRFPVLDKDGNPVVTLWPSDHAGVVATLWPAPGIFKKW